MCYRIITKCTVMGATRYAVQKKTWIGFWLEVDVFVNQAAAESLVRDLLVVRNFKSQVVKEYE